MSKFYKKVVVIGAGTMGSGIAAHLANSKIHTILLDLPSEGEDKNKISNNAIVNIKKSDPPLLIERNCLNYIQAGNLEDDLHHLGDADWIIEVDAGNLSGIIKDFTNNNKVILTFVTEQKMWGIYTPKRAELYKSYVKVIFNEILLSIK